MSMPSRVFSMPSKSARRLIVVPGPRMYVPFGFISSIMNLATAVWFSYSSTVSGLICLLPCMRMGTKGPFRSPYSLIEKWSLRMAVSSTSIISKSIISVVSLVKASTISAASKGFTANMPLYILTPDGTPRTGVSLKPFIASRMSLAVPSPPTKTIRSTFDVSISLMASFVSSAVVSDFRGILRISAESRVDFTSVSPMTLGHVKISIGGLTWSSFNFFRNSTALAGAIGSAPILAAFFETPSVPFNPTLPPMPAMGFTMKPIFKLLITIELLYVFLIPRVYSGFKNYLILLANAREILSAQFLWKMLRIRVTPS